MSDTNYFMQLFLNDKKKLPYGLLEFNHFGYMWTKENKQKLIASHTIYDLLEIEPFSIFLTVEEFRKYVHPNDLHKLLQAEENVINNNGSASVEYRIICKNGKEKYILHHMHLSKETYVNETKIISILDDITAQKSADIILEIINEVFFELDENDVLIRVNKKAEIYFEANRNELIGKNINKIFPAISETSFYQLIKKSRQNKLSYTMDIIAPHNNWMHASIVPSNNNSVIFLYDIEHEKEAEKKLLQSEEHWRTLVHNTPDVLTRWDKNLKLLFANPAFEVKTGFFRSFALDKNIYEIENQKEIAEEWTEKIKHVFEKKEPENIYNFYSSAQNRNHFYTRLVPEFDNDGNVQTVLAISRNITELKIKEEEINRINQQLTRNNKELESRNRELIALNRITSHDLKDPLRKIYTSIEMILLNDVKNLSNNGRGHFRRLQSAVQKMGLITDDLLTYMNASENDNEEKTTIDLNEVLEEAKSKINKIIQEKKALIINEYSLPYLQGYKSLLVQLFQNIIHNAIKFQPKNNIPEVKILSKKVMISNKFSDDPSQIEFLKISFSDNGIGFANEDAAKLFTLFSRLDNTGEFKGNGIGLAVCKKIMEHHGGFIRAQSEGEGAEFCAYFP